MGAVLSPDTTSRADHRKGPRRRGEVLEHAILTAALEELAETGYAGLTMDRVAARARTSKSTVYRRWSSRAELLVDVWRRFAITGAEVPDTGLLRTDMIVLLRLLSDRLASHVGLMLRGLLAEMVSDPELARAVREQAFSTGPSAVIAVLQRAVARGEVAASVLDSRRATVATDLLRSEFLLHGAPVPDGAIMEIVDEIFLPLVLSAPHPGVSRP
ncbi:TetR/AcrR family transcriptional regulator [Spirillospora sp. NBC_01491]|uniref:TetR/AcrR family transcriptional regulator n=1 Tax=Spirillospora sp. NBC_01491 TaxID=2976007 RepID=UPI002E316A88|nr:TetR/AcrR family transcriptional regulator [Spirillospora sp. NBC_01491]